MLLSVHNISKSFGTDVILSKISFHVNEHDKAAIIGINGAGKSTLLKILTGEYSADEGEVSITKGTSVGYLAQHQDFSFHRTIYDEMLSVKQHIFDLEEQLRSLEQQMRHADETELELLYRKYNQANHQFEAENGYAVKSEITGILYGLGFSKEDFEKNASTLSGGQKTRVSLAKLLLSSPDLILLDEPTNHLDLNSIAWLESYLLNYKGTVIIVSHDRYFLDKIANRVIEIEQTKARMFLGNYSDFSEKKAQLINTLIKQYANQQREIKHQEEVITRLRSFNREKSIKRAESREKLLEKMDRMEKPVEENTRMNIRLEPRILSGKDVLSVKELKKSFGEHHLFSNLSFEIKRGERVAIIGDNGTGKTTILKILNQIMDADDGEFRLGSNVNIGYYDQEQQNFHPKNTLFDEIKEAYPDMDNTSIRNTLAAFLFTEDDVFKRIEDLSGGEKGRLSLALLMLSEANFLILDEPTNHLDIISKEILENALVNYTGTVLFVSHDRFFINKTATRILELANRKLHNYIGNYDYYIEKKAQMGISENGTASASKSVPATGSGLSKAAGTASDSDTSGATSNASSSEADWKRQKEEKAFLRKKENDIKKCEAAIEELENENARIDEELAKEENFTNVEVLMELNARKQAIEKELEEKMELWEELSS